MCEQLQSKTSSMRSDRSVQVCLERTLNRTCLGIVSTDPFLKRMTSRRWMVDSLMLETKQMHIYPRMQERLLCAEDEGFQLDDAAALFEAPKSKAFLWSWIAQGHALLRIWDRIQFFNLACVLKWRGHEFCFQKLLRTRQKGGSAGVDVCVSSEYISLHLWKCREAKPVLRIFDCKVLHVEQTNHHRWRRGLRHFVIVFNLLLYWILPSSFLPSPVTSFIKTTQLSLEVRASLAFIWIQALSPCTKSCLLSGQASCPFKSDLAWFQCESCLLCRHVLTS